MTGETTGDLASDLDDNLADGAVRIEAIGGPLGARVSGLRLEDGIDADTVRLLTEGLARHGLLLFRGASISSSAFVALGRTFGELEILPEPDKRDPDHPEIFNLSNVRPDGRIVDFDEPQAVFLRGTERWHTDSSFRSIPCLCTMLYAVEVPPSGGETWFADMVAGYESLPEAMKARLEPLSVVHSYEYSRANNPGTMEPMSEEEKAKFPPVVHPLVRTHADGRRSLYLGGHASHIEGMSEESGRELLAEVESLATHQDFVYRHRWEANDLVVWDNRSTLHKLRPYDIAKHRRVMRRLTVAGTEPVL